MKRGGRTGDDQRGVSHRVQHGEVMKPVKRWSGIGIVEGYDASRQIATEDGVPVLVAEGPRVRMSKREWDRTLVLGQRYRMTITPIVERRKGKR